MTEAVLAKGSEDVPSKKASSKPAKKAYSLRLDAETHERIVAYSKVYGRSESFIMERAIIEWLDTYGKVRLEAIQKFAAGDRRLRPEDLPSPTYTIEDAMDEKTVLDGKLS